MSENALALSDEEFEKLPVPVAEEPAEDTSTEPLEGSTTDDQDSGDTEVPEGDDDGLQEQETDEEAESTASEEGDVNETSEDENSEAEESTNSESQQELDYEKIYQEVFKPFKANGKEMKVESIEDVRQLMQMGANYNKKMAALKPNLKLMKMLENNGLLDESKLSYLIDLDKKNPEAVKKLVKETGIDPLDIDINAETSYKPNTYNVNDKELELDAVLSEIRETDTFNTTIDVIGNKWDEASKLVLLDNPNLIKIINNHVSNGVYQNITNEVERLRVLGKLDGLSDIDAYKAVGDALYANPAQQAANNIKATTSKATNTNKDDPRLKEKRKAASTTKSVAGNVKPNFNPLAMSDDEFEKIASSKFI
jgi:hypothetical protein